MNLCKHILVYSFLLIGLNSFAQKDSIKDLTFTSKIIDAKTKKPIEYALVTIEKDSFKKSKYADNNGEVIFGIIPNGIYSISISFRGYRKIKTKKLIILKDSNTFRKFKMIHLLKNIDFNEDSSFLLIQPDEPRIYKN